MGEGVVKPAGSSLRIGWAQTDITPDKPVEVRGQLYARVSEEILDPLTATALVLDSDESMAVLVSCDVIAISEHLLDAVRKGIEGIGFDPDRLILNATHSHASLAVMLGRYGGVDLPVEQTAEEAIAITAERICGAIHEAWSNRRPGAVAFGLGHAVVSHNRRTVTTDGKSRMYGKIDHPGFNHVEGYEDHDLNLLATYDTAGALTGLLINVASPSQVREKLFAISADYWHETRVELRRRLGDGIFILPQCSAAGDQGPFCIRPHIYNHRAEERMLNLKHREPCEEIARRLADGVEEILPWIHDARESAPVFRHVCIHPELPFNKVSQEDAEDAKAQAAHHREQYEVLKQQIEADPNAKLQPRWYQEVSKQYLLARRHERLVERFEQFETCPTLPIELHLLRIGDMAMATNPFEYYLDYGIQMKARSPAVQTFVVQLCGPGSYVPSSRSLIGGGYGSVPASNIFGPDAGGQLRDRTLEALDNMWQDEAADSNKHGGGSANIAR